MKRISRLLFLSLCLIFTLIACTDKDEVTYSAKASDFEGVGFERNGQKIWAFEEELFIYAAYNNPEAKGRTSIDKILESEDAVSGIYYEKRYKNAKIKTEKDMYYITAEGISLTFKKTGERIVSDEEGMEYYTSEYQKE